MFALIKRKISDVVVNLLVKSAAQNSVDAFTGKSTSDKLNHLEIMIRNIINKIGVFIHTNDSVNIDFSSCTAAEFINALPNRALILLNYGNINNSTFPSRYGTIFGVKLTSGWDYSIFFVCSGSALYLGVYHANEYPGIKWYTLFNNNPITINSTKLNVSNLVCKEKAECIVLSGKATVTSRESGVTTLLTFPNNLPIADAHFVGAVVHSDTVTPFSARITPTGIFINHRGITIEVDDQIVLNVTVNVN